MLGLMIVAVNRLYDTTIIKVHQAAQQAFAKALVGGSLNMVSVEIVRLTQQA